MRTSGEATGVEQSAVRGEGLALLYQGIFITIVRLHRGQPIQDANAVRNNVLAAFGQIEKEALRLDFGAPDIADANFAVASFLDETVLTSADPARVQWQRLHPDLAGRAVGGEEFYDRLRSWMRRPPSPQQASVLEVFLLCLLLGYRGKYAMLAESELRSLIDDLRVQLREPLGISELLCPGAELPAVPPPAAPGPRASGLRFGLQLALAAGFLLFAWLGFKLWLYVGVADVIKKLG
jgi:type VI secretion system protein ImpK